MVAMNAKPKKIRLDDLLVERGDFPDRATALRAVMAREVRVDDVYATSAAIKVAPHSRHLHSRPQAIRLPRRQETPGGAGRVQAGRRRHELPGYRLVHRRLHRLPAAGGRLARGGPRRELRAARLEDPPRPASGRLRAHEHQGRRSAEVGAPFDLIVIDVSFIGLAALAPLFPRFSRPGTIFIGLVKPQFESAHDETDRGVVRDEAVRLRTVEEVKAALAAAGFTATGVVESPITGPEGNVEYLVRAVFRNKSEAI